ncbi:MAG: hypothetical protein UMS36scaffold28_75 [Phage 59_13]|nr:MAG: hypothetical protein UMS36scaffold28_75 [Phage 59_13]
METGAALALPVSFVGLPDWRVIHWIVAHRNAILYYGLRYLAVSLIVTALYLMFLILFGYPPDDDDPGR